MSTGLTDQLDILLQRPDASVAGDIKVALSRLASEVKRRLDAGSSGSYDFLLSTLRTLSRMRGAYHADVRMVCLFDCATFFFWNRNMAEALECAKQLSSLARQSGDKGWIRKSAMLKGVAFSQLGDCGEAVLQFSTALTLTRELQQPDMEACVLNNLGTSLNYAGLYREAIPCLLRAISLTRSRPDLPSWEAHALCNLAQSHFYLGEYSQGMAAITSCLAISPEPKDALSCVSRVVREVTYVQMALEMGNVTAARKHTEACQHYARQSGMEKASFLAGIARGLCEIHGGNVSNGLEVLEKTLETSALESRTPEYADALAALVRAYDQTFQPEKALQRMSALLRNIRERRELGVTALLFLEGESGATITLSSEDSDLQVLTLREASLRVQVAEREAMSSRIEMLERLAITADIKEEASGEHGYRVGRLASLLAERLGLRREALAGIDLAARLHDIGKIAVPDRILLNSKELQEAERHFISTHTIIGAELLAKSNIPQLRMAEEIARHHHEWWNGEGYPSKLKGKRIPIHARIVALADVFDALTHGRPFSEPWPIDKALEEIRAGKGTQFDPELTDLFLELIAKLRTEHEDLDEYLGRAGRNSPFLQARNKIRLMLAEERENEKLATVTGNQTRH